MIHSPAIVAVVPVIPILIALCVLALLGAAVVVTGKFMGTTGEVVNGPVGYGIAGAILAVAGIGAWRASRPKPAEPNAEPAKPAAEEGTETQ